MMPTLGIVLCWATIGHPLAVTLAEVDYNRELKLFEVAWRVYPEALDVGLAAFARQQDNTWPNKPRSERIIAYLEHHFRLEQPGEASSLRSAVRYRWVGEQEERGTLWIYFEIPWAMPIDRLVIRSTTMFDVFREQMNTVLLKDRARSATCTLHAKGPASLVLWQGRSIPLRLGPAGIELR